MTPLAFSSIQFKGAGQTLAGGKISVRSQFVTSQRADYTFFFFEKGDSSKRSGGRISGKRHTDEECHQITPCRAD